MASLQLLKKRLQGVTSVRKMTSAMELVSATKMRKAQETALSSRGYALTALEILANVIEGITRHGENKFSPANFPLLAERTIKKTLVLLVSADRGLAGSFNSNVFRRLEKFLAVEREANPGQAFGFIAVGQRAAEYLVRNRYPTEASFHKFGDIIHLTETEPLSDKVELLFSTGAYDRVVVHSTHFFSTLHQEVLERQLLPVDFEKIRTLVEEMIPETGRYADLRRDLIMSRPEMPTEYLIEPSPEEALAYLLSTLLRMQVYHLVLEANASEHSARRTAMKNASDNAGDLIGNLTLSYNRSRQAAITGEIIEITSTAAAMEG